MRDFTLRSYRSLLLAFQKAGYRFLTFEEFLSQPQEGKTVVMRHDVDELAWNALDIARLENEMGVKATYYFRIVKQSNVHEVIETIVKLGHEIGYHYEDLALAEGDEEKALETFGKHLNYFRKYYPVKTVSMHGSSSSKYDNRLIWKNHRLSDYGLIGEPYLSIDFDKVFYMTDTGFAWDGGRYATRDVVVSSFDLKFHSTSQVVNCIERDGYPKQAMILAHTLWTDNLVQWYGLHVREFFRNNLKLMAKKHRFVGDLYGKMVKWYWKK